MLLKGKYKRTLYRDMNTGTALFTLETLDDVAKNEYNEVLVWCIIPHYDEGYPLAIEGNFTTSIRDAEYELAANDPFYGKNLCDLENRTKFIAITINTDYSNVSAMEKWLTQIPGVGEKTANKIQQILKPEQLMSDEFITLLSNSAEVSHGMASEIVRYIRRPVVMLKCMRIYGKYGITCHQIDNLWDIYHEKSVEKLASQPYVVGERIHLKFHQMDQIARDNHLNPLRTDRLTVLMNEAVQRVEDEGHTFFRGNDVIQALKRIPQAYNYTTDEEMLTVFQCENCPGYDRFPSIYMPDTVENLSEDVAISDVDFVNIERKEHERSIAKSVRRLFDSSHPLDINSMMVESISKETGIDYARQQRRSSGLLSVSGVKILTGGPGTGKTTTIQLLIKLYIAMRPNDKIKLCAPTGRAAQKMTEATGMAASTIHKLCDYRPYGDGEKATHKTSADPIDADLIICDEVSMVDIEIADILLSAVKNGATIIFVGDENQLGSVGPGNFLHDMIKSHKVMCWRLTDVFRQAQDSNIICNGKKILAGDANLTLGSDFRISYFKTPEELQKNCMNVLKKRYDRSNPFAVQVLSPCRMGPGGVKSINYEAQKFFNEGYTGPVVNRGIYQYHIDDKILMTENNYSAGYCNGDTGVIKDIKKDIITVDLIGEGVLELSRDNLSKMLPAYNMTIHKSQGSEYPLTILSLNKKAPVMLNRNLLYTGVTRAKEEVIILSEDNALETCIKSTPPKRNTTLDVELRKAFADVDFKQWYHYVLFGCL